MSDITDEELRAVGFSALARNYPRDELALRMFAAFQGNITVEQMPPGMKFFPNEATQQAWSRVADAAMAYVGEALAKIAAYDDAAASAYLRATGSYRHFDEPGSVEIARTALEGKDND